MELVKMSHGMQKFTNVVFLNTKKTNLNWSSETTSPTTFRCNFKMPVACASDNEGKNLFIS